jgi:hypothetical protein
MAHRVFYPASLVLFMATSITLFSLGWFLANPAVADPGAIATEEVVRSFYAAVNLAIQTGGTTALESVTARNLAIHGPLSSLAPDRAGLSRYLTALHATSPELELTIADLAASGDQALVTLAPQNAEAGSFLGSPLQGSERWGQVDALRVRSHRVIEVWSGADQPALLAPLAEAPFAHDDDSRMTMSLDRLTIQPGGSFEAVGEVEARWLYVEAGSVRVETNSVTVDLRRVIPGELSARTGNSGANQTTLNVGDFLALPVWSQTEIRNIGSETARLLVLAIGHALPRSATMNPDYFQGQSSTIGPSDPPKWWTGVQQATLGDATITSLTGTPEFALPSDRVTIEVGRVMLPPSSVLVTKTTGPQVVAVSEGVADLIATGETLRGYSKGKGDSNSSALEEGTGALLPSRTDIALHNPGAEPVVLTIIAFIPAIAIEDGSV